MKKSSLLMMLMALMMSVTSFAHGFQDKHNLLPIPLKELELNPNMEQNPGW